jgi:hypothetical protein
MDDQRIAGASGWGVSDVSYRRFRFSLKILLLVFTAAAVIFGAYTIGEQRGYERGSKRPDTHVKPRLIRNVNSGIIRNPTH